MIADLTTYPLDHETDGFVQRTLQTEFKDMTLIIVAHRLQTVMSADRIMVLDAGNLVEFDSPRKLLKKNGLFKALVEGSRDKEVLYGMVL